jgi:hypothetical protein
MTFAIAWDPAALFVFYRLPLHTATIVDRAVIRFAHTGAGHIEWVAPYHRLRAGVHDVALRIDTEARTIAVLRIYRARRSG